MASRRAARRSWDSIRGAPLTQSQFTSNPDGVRAGFGLRAVLILIGFTAAIAQIVLLRELMAVFYGNEISIGLMLASWLLWTAAGSSLAGRLAVRARNPRRMMAAIQVLLAAVLPCTVQAVRSAKGLLQTVPGEVLGPGPVLLTSLAVLGPLCVLSGALFTGGSRVYATTAAAPAGEASGSVYLWEAVGSSAGGLIAGLVLVRFLGSLEIALLVSILNLIAASGLALAGSMLRRAAIGMVAGIALVLEFFGVPRRAEEISQIHFWRGQHLVATRNSLYGNLAVVGTEGSRTLYENGVVLFNAPDAPAAEEAVHYALLEHPSPRSVLLIGGGINGSIVEALRHPTVERVDYVELDPAILDLAAEYFPHEWRRLRADPRVRVHVTDGRLFVKTSPLVFDVIIVNLPDPQNAQLNRFYTAEFFDAVSRKLAPGGEFSFQLRSSENYIAPELAQFLRSIHKSLRSVFPEVAAIPGETVHFFAAHGAGTLASGADELVSRLHARNLKTSYVSEYFIPFRMMPDRTLDLEMHIRPLPTTPVNRDFAPIAYYFDVALWSSQFNPGYRKLFRALASTDFKILAAVVGIMLAALAVGCRLLRQRRHRLQAVAGFCTASTGFTMIGLEMFLLLGFQAVYGYVYRQLAVLIAAFMAGMALGSWLALRRPDFRDVRLLGITQMLVAASPVILIFLLEAAQGANGNVAMAATSAIFPAAALGSGMLAGFQFPVASRMFFRGAGPSKEASLGSLYALDLAGSCLGAMLFSGWFIPVFGFFKTALLSAMVSLAPAVAAMLLVSEGGPGEGTPVAACARRTPGR
jgi:spermidine synthase